MGWTRLDDNVLDHPKVVGLSLEAEAVFYRGCVYVNRQQSRGFIPAGVLPHLARGKAPKQRAAIAAALTAAQLWHERSGGWEVHDWQDYARPARNSDALREAGARGGRRSAEVRLAIHGTAQPNPNPEATPKPLASTGFGGVAGSVSKPLEAFSPKRLEARATGRDWERHQGVDERQTHETGEALDTDLIARLLQSEGQK